MIYSPLSSRTIYNTTYFHFFIVFLIVFVMRCTIWYRLYNLKNVKKTHGGVLLLVKLQAKSLSLPKVAFLQGCFSRF